MAKKKASTASVKEKLQTIDELTDEVLDDLEKAETEVEAAPEQEPTRPADVDNSLVTIAGSGQGRRTMTMSAYRALQEAKD